MKIAFHRSVFASKVLPSPQSSRLSESTSNTSQLPSKSKIKVTCLIFSEAVEDQSAKRKGHDAIFGDGNCIEWVNQQCARLSKVSFPSVLASDSLFCCLRCVINQPGDP